MKKTHDELCFDFQFLSASLLPVGLLIGIGACYPFWLLYWRLA